MVRDRFVSGTPLGRWQTNCWVVGDRGEGSCVVIDPGEGGLDHVGSTLEDEELDCEAILLTHGHLDHFWAAPDLARDLDVPVLLHEDDLDLWQNPGAGFGVEPEVLEETFGLVWDPADDHLQTVGDGDKLSFCGIDYTVRHNPGHTPGHVTFLGHGLDEADISFSLGDPRATERVLFSGDLIFAGSVGRTDFPGGDTDALLTSIVDTVLPLEDDTLILSGHGPDTTVGRERAGNPYVDTARQRHG